MSKRILLSGKEFHNLYKALEDDSIREYADELRSKRMVVIESDEDMETDLKLCNRAITQRDIGMNIDDIGVGNDG